LIEGIIKTGSMLNWVYAQLLALTSPYFSDARDLGLITHMSPYFDTLDLGLLPYTS
jgi:hypothetical protein